MGTITGNENNPATLKLLIANNYAQAKYKVNLKGINEDTRYLPYLTIESEEEILFIPNAAIWYIFPPAADIFEQVTELLEIESTVLSTSLAFIVGNNIKSDTIRSSMLSSLEKHNLKLNSKSFFVGDSITIADIAVFSTLYPLYKCEKFYKEYLVNLNNITRWMQKLESEPKVKEAIAVVFHQNVSIGQSSYQILVQSSKYLVPQVHSEMSIRSISYDKESPKHEVESVTPEELKAAENAWNKDINQLPKLKVPDKVVLPKSGEKNIFITSALPYVNNVPHLGNIIGCVLSADVFARYSRLCNKNTLFICGTDEYGTATETKALEEGLSCQMICDKYFKIHSEIYKWFNISFDHFGRTSTPEQTELAQDLFLQLNHNGFTFTQSVDQLHCEKCNRYLADRFVEGGCHNIGCNYEDARGDQCDGCGKLVNATELRNPRCKICGNTPKLKRSSQFFIDLPKLEPLVRHWVQLSSPGWTHNADVITKSWLKEGLKPRCITRDLKWGVPVPLDGFRDKVFYVWFDAPIGYISISKAYTKEYEKWWKPAQDTKVALYQFMAKDNVPFHAVLFPSMLLGANRGYVTVSHIMATEYLNYEDGKFSKSRGIGVFGNDARDTKIPSDVWRFYLLYVRPESQDSCFSWNDLATKNNSELLNNLGNFINRALIFIKNSFNKTLPTIELSTEDYHLLALCTREFKGYMTALEKCKLRDGIRHILAISRHGNQYMQMNQPWVKVKEAEEGKLRAGTVVGVCANLACLLAMLLQPYMPETSAKLRTQLNCNDVVLDPNNVEIPNLLPSGHQIGEPHPLFSKIEPELVEEYKKKFAGTQEARTSPPKKTAKAPVTNNVDIQSLVAEVAKQALVVRHLKEGGKENSVWQPEVTKLLALKKQLADAAGLPGQEKEKPASKNVKTPINNHVGEPITNGVDAKVLEEKVAKQALEVRKLKEDGAEKSVWQPEVEKLLVLKKKLADATGVAVLTKGKKSKK